MAIADKDSVEFMIGKSVDEIAPLEAARLVLEKQLAQHEDWRALQQLETREASGEPIVAVGSGRLRASLVAALEHNRCFRAHRALHTAIQALRGEDEHILPVGEEIPQSSSSEIEKQHGQPIRQPKSAKESSTPATNGQEADGATSAKTHSTNNVSTRGNSVPTLTLKIVTPTPAVAKQSRLKPTVPAIPAKSGADDLTRIWNIDNGLARRLNEHGITTWQQIADWRAKDVKTVSSALMLDRHIQQDGWIEQAAQLYQRQIGARSAPMPLCLNDPSATQQAVRGSGLAAASGDALSLPLAPIPSMASNPARANPAAGHGRNELETKTVGEAPTPGPAPRPDADRSPQAATAAVPDKLNRIRGIDGTLAKRLAELGVTSFAQIAQWHSSDVQRFGTKLDLAGRIAQQNWIEQAAVLKTGQLTQHARNLASGLPKIVSRPPPLPLRPATTTLKQNQPHAAQQEVEKTSAADAVPTAPTRPRFAGGLPAALAKLGIAPGSAVIPSHGLTQVRNETSATLSGAATVYEPVEAVAGKPTDQRMPALATGATSETVRDDAAGTTALEPKPGETPLTELEPQPEVGKEEEFAAVEKSAPAEDILQLVPKRRTRRLDRPAHSNGKPIPGITPELAETLANIDRLSDETEALLGNSRRQTPTPPDESRRDNLADADAAGNELSSAEADVIIVSHSKPTPRQTLAASTGRRGQRSSLNKKARYPTPARPDGGSLSGTHSTATNEATVEIDEHGGKPSAPSAGSVPAASVREQAGSIRRFLKALSGE